MLITDPEALKEFYANIDWDEYERRVERYESEGMDRSDAQAVVDLEMMRERG